MNKQAIGVFDSGLGGLTTVRELRKILPGEDIVYFGDTGRVPYGSRGRDIIISYAKQDIAFLLTQNVKAILAACGTVSSTFPPQEAAKLLVPYYGVVAAATKAALKASRSRKIGIIATEATISSGSYQSALYELCPQVHSIATACPLFVPLVENGYFAEENPVVAVIAADYLAPIKAAGVDTLILGCTHYPLLKKAVRKQIGPDVKLIDVGMEVARQLKKDLTAANMLSGRENGGKVSYFVTDDTSRFDHFAHLFLGGYAGGEVQRINIEDYKL